MASDSGAREASVISPVFFNYRIVTFFSRSGTVGARTVHGRSDRGCIFFFCFPNFAHTDAVRLTRLRRFSEAAAQACMERVTASGMRTYAETVFSSASHGETFLIGNV